MQIGEHETKFIFPNFRSNIVRQYLSKQCSPDPLHAEGIISSIYFDTRDEMMLGEKQNSDFSKIKIRLRWYSSTMTNRQGDALFLEVKRKVGSARQKKRFLMPNKSDWASSQSLCDPGYFCINSLLASKGIHLNQPVFPILQINYRRSRYNDPLSAARLSLDSDINVSRINTQMLGELDQRRLQYAVFEHKCSNSALPDWLHMVNTIADSRKSSFSKYGMCIEYLRY